MTEDNYVAFCHYDNGSISTCDSDSKGAFKVYRSPNATQTSWKSEMYMPTMDEAHRFIKSNPKTSAEILAEVQRE